MHGVREAKQTLHCIMYDRYSTCAHVTILRTPVTLLLCGSLRRLLGSKYPTTDPYSKPV